MWMEFPSKCGQDWSVQDTTLRKSIKHKIRTIKYEKQVGESRRTNNFILCHLLLPSVFSNIFFFPTVHLLMMWPPITSRGMILSLNYLPAIDKLDGKLKLLFFWKGHTKKLQSILHFSFACIWIQEQWDVCFPFQLTAVLASSISPSATCQSMFSTSNVSGVQLWSP